MKIWNLRIAIVGGLLAAICSTAVAQVQNHDICDTVNVAPQALKCAFSISPLTLVPMTAGTDYISQTDLSQTPYETYLYPEKSNNMPVAHRISGEALAASVQPLDANGRIDPVNGKILVIVEGISNTFHEANYLIDHFRENNPAVNPKVELVNKSIPGCPLVCWVNKGVQAVDPQVQIVIIKHSNNMPQEITGAPRFPEEPFTTTASKRFPRHAEMTKRMLKTRILNLHQQYPNLKQVFLTSRSYGGWTCSPAAIGHSEPVAFEEGFSTKWLLEDQILNKDPDLAFSGLNAKAPWMAWGPYIWDPTWTQDMFSDGVHPCSTGQKTVAQQWYDFLMNDGSARPWFRDNDAPTKPANLASSIINSSQVSLSWNHAIDNSNAVWYKVYRNGFFQKRVASNSYVDTGLQSGQTYCYTISAIDSAGNESEPSDQSCATILSTDIADGSAQPESFQLFQNYPNPFNPETEIRFQLPKASTVTLTIYNTLGDAIRTLAHGSFSAGEYRLQWDGRDQLAQAVASGVYLYQLRATETDNSGKVVFSQIKRMALLR